MDKIKFLYKVIDSVTFLYNLCWSHW